MMLANCASMAGLAALALLGWLALLDSLGVTRRPASEELLIITCGVLVLGSVALSALHGVVAVLSGWLSQ